VAAALIKNREATEAPQTGWSLTEHVSECILRLGCVSDHPVRASLERDHFLMARPPLLTRRGMSPTERFVNSFTGSVTAGDF